MGISGLGSSLSSLGSSKWGCFSSCSVFEIKMSGDLGDSFLLSSPSHQGCKELGITVEPKKPWVTILPLCQVPAPRTSAHPHPWPWVSDRSIRGHLCLGNCQQNLGAHAFTVLVGSMVGSSQSPPAVPAPPAQCLLSLGEMLR